MARIMDWPLSSHGVTVKAGNMYRVDVSGVSCRSGFMHLQGETLEVEAPTMDVPFDEVGPRGINWIVKTRHDTSVWATLESCIARGILVPA